ncbi:MAG: hypothetical protein IKT40_12250 [Bacilli bacterium]|nr:hypothetical protein [Bacilli bacterium]
MKDKEIKFLVERLVRQEMSQLIEYAHPRKEFVFRVERLFKQIIIHYCLIIYNRNINNEDYIQHWKTELFGWISALSNMDIKSNNSPKNRYNAVIEALNNIGYINDINKIKNCIALKASEENMNINSEEMNKAMINCQEALYVIANIIANNDMVECNNFISQI